MSDARGPAGVPPEARAGDRLGRAFARGRPALVVYLMAGYPDRETSLVAMRAAAEAGADLIELGVPYTDALADGPVIVRAANAAMDAAGGRFGLEESLGLAAEFTGGSLTALPPVAMMTYYNPMLRRGLERTAEDARRAGISGFIVPDLPPDEARPWLDASRGIDTVFLAAPTSTPERLELVGSRSAGFVYCVSTTGITGERDDLPPQLAETVERVRAHTTLPVAVGFGVSTPAQAAAVARIADGVIVGSACVRRQGSPDTLAGFVRELAEAVRSPEKTPGRPGTDGA